MLKGTGVPSNIWKRFKKWLSFEYVPKVQEVTPTSEFPDLLVRLPEMGEHSACCEYMCFSIG